MVFNDTDHSLSEVYLSMSRLGCLLFAISLLSPGLLAAQESIKVTGIVKQVDLTIGTVTVRPNRKGATEDETYSFLKKDIEVTTPAGEKTKLDAVAPGLTVQLKIGATGDVEGVVIQAAVFLATVVDVDAQNRKITIARQENRATAMPVAADVKVLLSGRSAYLREVKPGSQMNVSASLDGKTVVGLNLVSDPDGKLATKLFPRVKISKLPGVRYVGVVTEVEPARSELKLVGPKTKGVPQSMRVAKEAVIQSIYGQVVVQKVTLHQVAKQTYATVLVSTQNEQVTRVFVEPPQARGKVRMLDADGGQLTVVVNGAEKTFALPSDIKVMNGTRVMRLADLQPNLLVNLVLSLDRKQLLAVDVREFATP